jgi:hypothetical protein
VAFGKRCGDATTLGNCNISSSIAGCYLVPHPNSAIRGSTSFENSVRLSTVSSWLMWPPWPLIRRCDDLGDHLAFVQKLPYPAPNDDRRVAKLRDILGRAHARAHITCFWHGNPGETAPQIPDRFKSAIEPLAADIETDFAVGKHS